MKRIDYNLEILKIVKSRFSEYSKIFEILENYINKNPSQRFGQIICNYICPDYRDITPSVYTVCIMSDFFPENPDPFFEESKETYERFIK